MAISMDAKMLEDARRREERYHFYDRVGTRPDERKSKASLTEMWSGETLSTSWN